MKLTEQVFKEFKSEPDVKMFLQTISKYKYCVIGGLAVALYSKGSRTVSPDDMDVYLAESQIESFLNDLMDQGFKILKNHHFQGAEWYVVSTGNEQEFDIALQPDSSKFFEHPTVFHYKNQDLKVIEKKYLVINKLDAKRNKDLRDVLFLLRDESFSFIQLIRKRISGEERELLDQLVDDLSQFDLMVDVYS